MSKNSVKSSVQIDNDRVRVTLWEFDPGASTGLHRHEFDYRGGASRFRTAKTHQ